MMDNDDFKTHHDILHCELRDLSTGVHEGSYITWCNKCGLLTHCSDALVNHADQGREDHHKWSERNIEAFGCYREAHGDKKCTHWCAQGYCPVTYKDKSINEFLKNEMEQEKINDLIAKIKSIPWAPWVKWVAHDENKKWFAFDEEPDRYSNYYDSMGECIEITTIILPTFPDWRKSKIRVNEDAKTE